jgi:ferrochelatase
MTKQAVLLLAHGTPETIAQIPEYLRNVTGGRPLPPAVIEEIQRRYALIGHSPLTEITFAQARLVEAELAAVAQIHGSEPVRVYVGMRNWQPYIADVLRQMRADGVEEAAVLCLAPQNSRASVGLYRRALQTEVAAETSTETAAGAFIESSGLRLDFTESWAEHPLLIEAFAERLRPAWARLSAEVGAPVPVLFTVHSVPCRATQTAAEPSPAQSRENQADKREGQFAPPCLEPGEDADHYAEETRRTAALVAAHLPEIPRWWFAFQSQGASSRPGSSATANLSWLGPTVEQTLESVAASGVRALLLQPIGFLSDHVEILYDVDIHFREFAVRLNLRLERPESLNASVLLARALADLARQGLARLASRRKS